MKHASPATVKGATHICKIAGCKMDNYKARPDKKRPYLGSAMPKENTKVFDKDRAMKNRPRSQRQARRVAEQQWNKQRNKEYYQVEGTGAPWKWAR